MFVKQVKVSEASPPRSNDRQEMLGTLDRFCGMIFKPPVPNSERIIFFFEVDQHSCHIVH
jgi:hypothetical protein